MSHVQPIAAGEVVLRIPLKLALTDYPGDEESNRLMYEVRWLHEKFNITHR